MQEWNNTQIKRNNVPVPKNVDLWWSVFRDVYLADMIVYWEAPFCFLVLVMNLLSVRLDLK